MLAIPAPSAYLSNFTPDGLEFTVSYVIGDLQNGQLNARGAVNVAILRALRAAGIAVASAQRVVHWIADEAPGAASGPAGPKEASLPAHQEPDRDQAGNPVSSSRASTLGGAP